MVPLERHLAALRRQLLIGLLIGAGVAGIIAFSVVKFSQYIGERRPVSNSVAKPAAEVPSQPVPVNTSPSVAPSDASTASPDVFAIGKQKTGQKKVSAVIRPPAAPTPEPAIQPRLPKGPL
jgi:hypothetical protein